MPKQIEANSEQLVERWTSANPELTSYSTHQYSALLAKQRFLESSILSSVSLADLLLHENTLRDLSRDLIIAENSVSTGLQEYQSQYAEIDKEIRRAEITACNLSNTSIQGPSLS